MGAAEVFDEFSDADSSRVGDRSTGDLESVIPIVRRIIRARVSDQAVAEDLVQETLVKVLARKNRIEPGMLEPYAIVTARNVVKICGSNGTGNAGISIGSSSWLPPRSRCATPS